MVKENLEKIQIENTQEEGGAFCITLLRGKYKDTPINSFALISVNENNELKDIEVLGNMNSFSGQTPPRPPSNKTRSTKVINPQNEKCGIIYDSDHGIIYIQINDETETSIKINRIITLGKTKKDKLSAIWIKLPKHINEKLKHNESFVEVVEA